MHTECIHVAVQQKGAQHCKAITRHLKLKKKKKRFSDIASQWQIWDLNSLTLTPGTASFSLHLRPRCIRGVSRLLLPLAGTLSPHRHDLHVECPLGTHSPSPGLT